ncbi:MAG: alanine racemase [Kangiellaceae bacterium]|jgi:alanine racemase|nr:alanine racemase [Kangiellaceae bacterium]
MRPTRAVISLAAIEHNLAAIRAMAPSSKIMAVVKADAYGHGIVPVAKSLSAADALAVACIEEAIELRAGGITDDIILLEGFFEADEIQLIQEYQLQTVIHHQHQVDQLIAADLSQPIIVWLKLDTHMNRLGFDEQTFHSAYQAVKQIEHVSEIRLMTHFACADDITDDKTDRQLTLFKHTIEQISESRTAANSAGVLAWPETHFEWVRPGLMLYGCSPLPGNCGADHKLMPSMTLESKVIAVKDIAQGESVGYGAKWLAQENTRIAIIAIGYGDGYPRHIKNGGPVWLNDRIVPIAGRVSMDMIAVEVGLDSNDNVGDRVVLWGPELPVEKVAEAADTIPYTLLCAVTSRVKFHWVDSSIE